jgi:hypothetical protein
VIAVVEGSHAGAQSIAQDPGRPQSASYFAAWESIGISRKLFTTFS